MDAVTIASPKATGGLPISTLRFSLDQAGLATVAASPLLTTGAVPGGIRRLQDRFFDTADFVLAREGITLQLRKSGRDARLLLLHKGEAVEAVPSSAAPDLTAFGPEWQAALTNLLQDSPLHEVASASLRQTTRELGDASLSFQTGSLAVAGQKLPVSEIQLSGPAVTLPSHALQLAASFPLRLQPEPLGPRAVRLAGGPAPPPQKAAMGLNGDPCLDQAVQSVMSACLEQFLANWPAFFAGDEVSAVHQMRVAMRRLRSALGLFNHAVPTPEFLALRSEAKHIANAMSEARNWDVFIAMLRTGPTTAFPNEAGFAALEAQCAAHRQAGYTQVRAWLEDPATTRFLLQAQALIVQRGWRGGLAAELLPRLAAPAEAFGAASLERLYRKLRKHGKHLAKLPAQDRHRVRIDLKKLRYTVEFFGELVAPRQRVRAFHRAATALQDELGKLNDMATAEALAGRLYADSPEATRALGIVLGWTAHAARGEPRAISATWDEFRDAKPLA